MAADPRSIVRAIKKKGFRHVYIHIEMDVLDPDEYPWIKHPTPKGMMVKTLGKILSAIARSFHVTGLGLVEFTPAPMETASLTRTGIHPSLAVIKSLMDIFR